MAQTTNNHHDLNERDATKADVLLTGSGNGHNNNNNNNFTSSGDHVGMPSSAQFAGADLNESCCSRCRMERERSKQFRPQREIERLRRTKTEGDAFECLHAHQLAQEASSIDEAAAIGDASASGGAARFGAAKQQTNILSMANDDDDGVDKVVERLLNANEGLCDQPEVDRSNQQEKTTATRLNEDKINKSTSGGNDNQLHDNNSNSHNNKQKGGKNFFFETLSESVDEPITSQFLIRSDSIAEAARRLTRRLSQSSSSLLRNLFPSPSTSQTPTTSCTSKRVGALVRVIEPDDRMLMTVSDDPSAEEDDDDDESYYHEGEEDEEEEEGVEESNIDCVIKEQLQSLSETETNPDKTSSSLNVDCLQLLGENYAQRHRQSIAVQTFFTKSIAEEESLGLASSNDDVRYCDNPNSRPLHYNHYNQPHTSTSSFNDVRNDDDNASGVDQNTDIQSSSNATAPQDNDSTRANKCDSSRSSSFADESSCTTSGWTAPTTGTTSCSEIGGPLAQQLNNYELQMRLNNQYNLQQHQQHQDYTNKNYQQHAYSNTNAKQRGSGAMSVDQLQHYQSQNQSSLDDMIGVAGPSNAYQHQQQGGGAAMQMQPSIIPSIKGQRMRRTLVMRSGGPQLQPMGSSSSTTTSGGGPINPFISSYSTTIDAIFSDYSSFTLNETTTANTATTSGTNESHSDELAKDRPLRPSDLVGLAANFRNNANNNHENNHQHQRRAYSETEVMIGCDNDTLKMSCINHRHHQSHRNFGLGQCLHQPSANGILVSTNPAVASGSSASGPPPARIKGCNDLAQITRGMDEKLAAMQVSPSTKSGSGQSSQLPTGGPLRHIRSAEQVLPSSSLERAGAPIMNSGETTMAPTTTTTTTKPATTKTSQISTKDDRLEKVRSPSTPLNSGKMITQPDADHDPVGKLLSKRTTNVSEHQQTCQETMSTITTKNDNYHHDGQAILKERLSSEPEVEDELGNLATMPMNQSSHHHHHKVGSQVGQTTTTTSGSGSSHRSFRRLGRQDTPQVGGPAFAPIMGVGRQAKIQAANLHGAIAEAGVVVSGSSAIGASGPGGGSATGATASKTITNTGTNQPVPGASRHKTLVQSQWQASNTFSSSQNSDVSLGKENGAGNAGGNNSDKESSRRTSTLSGISSIYQQEVPYMGPTSGLINSYNTAGVSSQGVNAMAANPMALSGLGPTGSGTLTCLPASAMGSIPELDLAPLDEDAYVFDCRHQLPPSMKPGHVFNGEKTSKKTDNTVIADNQKNINKINANQAAVSMPEASLFGRSSNSRQISGNKLDARAISPSTATTTTTTTTTTTSTLMTTRKPTTEIITSIDKRRGRQAGGPDEQEEKTIFTSSSGGNNQDQEPTNINAGADYAPTEVNQNQLVGAAKTGVRLGAGGGGQSSSSPSSFPAPQTATSATSSPTINLGRVAASLRTQLRNHITPFMRPLMSPSANNQQQHLEQQLNLRSSSSSSAKDTFASPINVNSTSNSTKQPLSNATSDGANSGPLDDSFVKTSSNRSNGTSQQSTTTATILDNNNNTIIPSGRASSAATTSTFVAQSPLPSSCYSSVSPTNPPTNNTIFSTTTTASQSSSSTTTAPTSGATSGSFRAFFRNTSSTAFSAFASSFQQQMQSSSSSNPQTISSTSTATSTPTATTMIPANSHDRYSKLFSLSSVSSDVFESGPLTPGSAQLSNANGRGSGTNASCLNPEGPRLVTGGEPSSTVAGVPDSTYSQPKSPLSPINTRFFARLRDRFGGGSSNNVTPPVNQTIVTQQQRLNLGTTPPPAPPPSYSSPPASQYSGENSSELHNDNDPLAATTTSNDRPTASTSHHQGNRSSHDQAYDVQSIGSSNNLDVHGGPRGSLDTTLTTTSGTEISSTGGNQTTATTGTTTTTHGTISSVVESSTTTTTDTSGARLNLSTASSFDQPEARMMSGQGSRGSGAIPLQLPSRSQFGSVGAESTSGLDTSDDYEQIVANRRPSFQRQLDEQVNQVYQMAVTRKLSRLDSPQGGGGGGAGDFPCLTGSRNQVNDVNNNNNDNDDVFSDTNVDKNFTPEARSNSRNNPDQDYLASSSRPVSRSIYSAFVDQNVPFYQNTPSPHGMPPPQRENRAESTSVSPNMFDMLDRHRNQQQQSSQQNEPFHAPLGSHMIGLHFNPHQYQPVIDSSQNSIDSNTSSARSLRSCWFSMPELYSMNWGDSRSSQSPDLAAGVGIGNTNQQLAANDNIANNNHVWPSHDLYKQIATETEGREWTLNDLNLTSDDIEPNRLLTKQPFIEPIASTSNQQQPANDVQVVRSKSPAVITAANVIPTINPGLTKNATLDDCMSIKSSSSGKPEAILDSRPTSQNSTISGTSGGRAASAISDDVIAECDAAEITTPPESSKPEGARNLLTPQLSLKQRAMSLVPMQRSPSPSFGGVGHSGLLSPSSPAPQATRRRSAAPAVNRDMPPAAATLGLRMAGRNRNRVKLTDLHPITFINDHSFLKSMESLKPKDPEEESSGKSNKLTAILNSPVGRRLSINADAMAAAAAAATAVLLSSDAAQTGGNQPNAEPIVATTLASDGSPIAAAAAARLTNVVHRSNIKIGLTGCVYFDQSSGQRRAELASIRNSLLSAGRAACGQTTFGANAGNGQLAMVQQYQNPDGDNNRRSSLAPNFWLDSNGQRRLSPTFQVSEEVDPIRQVASSSSKNGFDQVDGNYPGDDDHQSGSARRSFITRPRAASCTPTSTSFMTTSNFGPSLSPPTFASAHRRPSSPSGRTAADRAAVGMTLTEYYNSPERRRSTISLLGRLSESSIELEGELGVADHSSTINDITTTNDDDDHQQQKQHQHQIEKQKMKHQSRCSSSQAGVSSGGGAGTGSGHRPVKIAKGPHESDSSSSGDDDGDIDKLVAQYPVVVSATDSPTIGDTLGGPRRRPTSAGHHRGPWSAAPSPYKRNPDRVVRNETILRQLLMVTNAINCSPPVHNLAYHAHHSKRRFSAINLYQRDDDVFVANSMKRAPCIVSHDIASQLLSGASSPLTTYSQNNNNQSPLTIRSRIGSPATDFTRPPSQQLQHLDHQHPEALLSTQEAYLDNSPNMLVLSTSQRQLDQRSTIGDDLQRPNSSGYNHEVGEVDVEEQLMRLRQQERRSLGLITTSDSASMTPPPGSLAQQACELSQSPLPSIEPERNEIRQVHQIPEIVKTSNSIDNESNIIQEVGSPTSKSISVAKSSPPTSPKQNETTTGKQQRNLSTGSIEPSGGLRDVRTASISSGTDLHGVKQLDTIIEGQGLQLGLDLQSALSGGNNLPLQRRRSSANSRRSSLGCRSNANEPAPQPVEYPARVVEWCRCDLSPSDVGRRRRRRSSNQEIVDSSSTKRSSTSSAGNQQTKPPLSRKKKSSLARELNQPINEIDSPSKYVVNTVKNLAKRTLTFMGGSTEAANESNGAVVQNSQLNDNRTGSQTTTNNQQSNSTNGTTILGFLSKTITTAGVTSTKSQAREYDSSETESADSVDEIDGESSSSSSTSSSGESRSSTSLIDAEIFHKQNKDNKMQVGRSLESSCSSSLSYDEEEEQQLQKVLGGIEARANRSSNASSGRRSGSTGATEAARLSRDERINGDSRLMDDFEEMADDEEEHEEEEELEEEEVKICYKCNKRICESISIFGGDSITCLGIGSGPITTRRVSQRRSFGTTTSHDQGRKSSGGLSTTLHHRKRMSVGPRLHYYERDSSSTALSPLGPNQAVDWLTNKPNSSTIRTNNQSSIHLNLPRKASLQFGGRKVTRRFSSTGMPSDNTGMYEDNNLTHLNQRQLANVQYDGDRIGQTGNNNQKQPFLSKFQGQFNNDNNNNNANQQQYQNHHSSMGNNPSFGLLKTSGRGHKNKWQISRRNFDARIRRQRSFSANYTPACQYQISWTMKMIA